MQPAEWANEDKVLPLGPRVGVDRARQGPRLGPGPGATDLHNGNETLKDSSCLTVSRGERPAPRSDR